MRRRGLASALVRICADDLRARGLVPVLDATEQGQPVYEKQGFVPQFRYDRWQIDGEGSMPALRPGPATDAQAIAHLDAQGFGAARPALLRAFLTRSRSAPPTPASPSSAAAVAPGRPGRSSRPRKTAPST